MWRNQSWRWIAAVTCSVGLGAAAWSVHAAQETAAADKPSQEEMMAQYAALAQPGPEHAALTSMEGQFTAECTSYCDPEQVQTFTGTQNNAMILGGRFLQSEYEGEMMGQPFTGFGLTGYDNINKKYISLWADTMGTSWMTSEGTADAARKVFTLTGTHEDPVTGQTMTMRQVTTVIDDDHYRFEMFAPMPGSGSDVADTKMMQIEYTRQ